VEGVRDYREKWKCISRNKVREFITEISILCIKYLLEKQMSLKMSSVKEVEGKF